MDLPILSNSVHFARFRLDRRARRLFRQGQEGTPVAIGSRAFDILELLIDRAGDLVPKSEIMRTAWPQMAVEEANLTMQISALRRVLDDDRPQERLIQTVPRRGYRFVGQVTAVADAGSSPSPARLSIVVLPFANLGGDPEQGYFADAITEDLTTDLSRIRDLVVISRNSAFTYKDQPIDVKQIGRDLGVRYVLEGSVRRSGTQVRVNAQLIDAETGAHLWADRFDRDISDLFALQDEVTSRIGNTLGWELIRVEAVRPTERPEALDYIFRGRAAFAQRGGDDINDAIRLFEQALTADPRSLEARGRLAQALVRRGIYSEPAGEREDFARAEGLIAEVLVESPGDPLTHFVRGYLFQSQRRPAEAIPEYEATAQNFVGAFANLGLCKFLVGASDQEAIALIERGIRRSPRDPLVGFWYGLIGWIHLMQLRVDDAIVWLEKGRAGPGFYTVQYSLAAAYGLKGEGERAAAELAEAQRLTGDRFSTIAKFRTNDALYTPAVRDRFEGAFLAGLRKAGLPEE
jgi:adenylate cyclase